MQISQTFPQNQGNQGSLTARNLHEKIWEFFRIKENKIREEEEGKSPYMLEKLV